MMVDSQVASTVSDTQMAIVVSLPASAPDSGDDHSGGRDGDFQDYEQYRSPASL